jgi:hypothetical protein
MSGVDVLVSCGLWTMATGVSIIIRERFARYTVRSKCNLVIELQAMYFKTYCSNNVGLRYQGLC